MGHGVRSEHRGEAQDGAARRGGGRHCIAWHKAPPGVVSRTAWYGRPGLAEAQKGFPVAVRSEGEQVCICARAFGGLQQTRARALTRPRAHADVRDYIATIIIYIAIVWRASLRRCDCRLYSGATAGAPVRRTACEQLRRGQVSCAAWCPTPRTVSGSSPAHGCTVLGEYSVSTRGVLGEQPGPRLYGRQCEQRSVSPRRGLARVPACEYSPVVLVVQFVAMPAKQWSVILDA
jgi:hypothetical protein